MNFLHISEIVELRQGWTVQGEVYWRIVAFPSYGPFLTPQIAYSFAKELARHLSD